jgi:dCMP deaminase
VSVDPREPDLRSGRRRPNWDEYFMLIAVATRERAECLGRHVGAVLVREGRIVATGYNGTPRGFPRCNASEQGCHRCAHRERYPSGSAYDVCICVHAEQNAILQAARLGYSLEGAHCYTTLRPCFGCLKELRQAGAERIVYLNAWSPNGNVAREAYHELLGQLAALGTAIEQLDLDPAVLQLSLGGPPAAAGPGP